MASEKEEQKQFGSARVARKAHTKFKRFLEKKSRKWSWFVRGILLFNEQQLQELYNQIEQAYEQSESN